MITLLKTEITKSTRYCKFAINTTAKYFTACVLDSVLFNLVAGLMVLSRPGLDELLSLGYVFPVVFGFALALEYSKRNVWISSFGFLVTTCSVTVAAPLAILMAFRRDAWALGVGLVMTAVVWASVAMVLSNGDAVDFQRVIQQDFRRSLETGLSVSETQVAQDVNQACWERLDLTPTTTKILEGGYFKEVDSVSVGMEGSLPFRGATGISSDAGKHPTTALAVSFKRFSYNGGFDLSWLVALACLAFGATCLLLEKRRSQRQGLASRSGVLIALLTLLALPHGVNDGVLVWLPLIGLLFGFPVLVAGLNGFVRWLMAVALLVVVFNFLTPELLRETKWIAGMIPADSWQAFVVASLNPILLAVAALLTGLSSVVSQCFAGDPPKAVERASEDRVGVANSRRQQEWAKLKRP